MIKSLTIFLLGSLAISNSDEIVEVVAPTVVIHAGVDSVMMNISIKVKDGYHIQADKVGNDLIPTSLEIHGDGKIVIRNQIFPLPRKFKLEGTDESLDVYGGTFEIGICLQAEKDLMKGRHELAGKLTYQACDSVRCLFPRVAGFLIEVEVR